MPISLVPPRKGRSPNYRVRGTYLGVYVDESTGTRRKEIARRYKKRREEQIESGFNVERSPESVADAALKYLQACPKKEIARVRAVMLHFTDTLISDLSDDLIAEYATTRYPPGPSSRPAPQNASINREIITPLSAMVHNIGIDRRFRRYKEMPGRVRLDAPSKIAAFLEKLPVEVVSEYGRARGNIRYPRACGLFVFSTGCRRIDAFKLDWKNIDLIQRLAVMKNTKNGDDRTVHLNETIWAALANLPKRDGPVFGYLGIDTINRDWRDARDKCGLDGLTPHGARHNFASWLRQDGMDTKGVMEMGGWKDFKSVLRYEHVPNEEKKAAFESSPLNRKVR